MANGTWHVIEHKVCVAAHSYDGIKWSDRRIVLERRRDVTTEDIGVGSWRGPGERFIDITTWKVGRCHDWLSLRAA